MFKLIKPFVLVLLKGLGVLIEFTKRIALATGNKWIVIGTVGATLLVSWLVFLQWGETAVYIILGICLTVTLVLTGVSRLSTPENEEKIKVWIKKVQDK